MHAERWRRIENLYHALTEVEEDKRAAFLDEACSGDEDLRSELDSLLLYDNEMSAFIESPALQVVAESFAECLATRGDTPPLPNTTLSHYRLIAPIGHGGMGVVFKAEDTRLNRLVALKFLPAELRGNDQALARLRAEARAASALDHSNICTIYEIGEAEGETFISMQFLDGRTLKQLISGKPLSITFLLNLALQISDALDVAHQAGIIHRDIKPQNLFVTKREQLKVLDFGIAKMHSHGARQIPVHPAALIFQGNVTSGSGRSACLTTPRTFIGTLAYMSPEQVRREELDPRTDLYSFGSVLYEMATGILPFRGDSAVLICNSILNCSATPVRRINPNVPADLERIINKALEKNRELRYQSASEIRSDLRRLALDLERNSRSDSWRQRIAIAGVIFAIFSLWWFSLRRREIQPIAIEHQITANPPEDWVSGGAISPDGNTVAYHDQTGVYLRSLQSGETHAISLSPAFSNRIWYLSWWPDGKRLFVPTTVEGDLPGCNDVWSISATGEPKPQLILSAVCNQSISPDGRSLVFTGKGSSDRRSGLWILRLVDGTRRYLRGIESDLVFSPVWSPDGQLIAYVRFRMTTQGLATAIEVQPAIGGPAKTLISNKSLPERMLICYLGSSASPCLSWLPDWRLAFSTFTDPSELGVQKDNGIWEISTVRGTGGPTGKPKQLIHWAGIAAGNLQATAKGKDLSFVKTSTWEDVFLARLVGNGRKMLPARRFTLDNRGSEPSGWTLDSKAVLFSSDRTGRPEVFKQAIDSNDPERIAHAPGHNCGGAIITPDGSWILYREGIEGTPLPNTPGPPARLMRQHASGGVPQPVLEQPADKEWNFACPVKAKSSCILAQTERQKLVFYALDAIRGKGAKIGSVQRTFATGLRDWNLKADGSEVAFASPDGHIKVLSVSGRTWHEIRLDPGWIHLQSIAWAADGNGFFVTCWLPDSFDLLYVSLTGKVARLLHNGRHQAISSPLPSPDGKYLAFDAETWDSNLWLLENF